MNNFNDIASTLEFAVTELISFGKLKKDSILVLGCSTSEVIGKKIGTFGSLDVAKIIYDSISKVLTSYSIHLAVQCCEHLNRALVVEQEVAKTHNLEIVNVVPGLHAGGAMATYTYSQLKSPCIVEFIKADAGIDIGDVLIGMHLKHVAVPFRIEGIRTIGNASLVMAFTRPKYIGGIRATYNAW
jgi:uncharacterized protein (TIGR01440 family)